MEAPISVTGVLGSCWTVEISPPNPRAHATGLPQRGLFCSSPVKATAVISSLQCPAKATATQQQRLQVDQPAQPDPKGH